MAFHTNRQQTIRDWSVVADNRLVGRAYNSPGRSDGKTILTSPVQEVRLMGKHSSPVAFTESGSVYWLADPSCGFGIDAAETFVFSMSRSIAQAGRAEADPAGRTKVPDRSFGTA